MAADKKPTRTERALGWYKAWSDIEPLLVYTKAAQRKVTLTDLATGKSVADLMHELLNARRDEIEQENDADADTER